MMDDDMQMNEQTPAVQQGDLNGQHRYDPTTGLPILEADHKMLDLVFVQDCTGSQGSYITSATKNIEEICATIFASGKLTHPEDLRVGLIAFRDHPPQDHTYITRKFDFTSDIRKVHESLSTLYASGGGDGPEAVTAGLWEALNMDWRDTASKMVVLIADAPPHGIGDYGDGFEEGSPDGHDPLEIARQMAQRGITLFFVACEPALSGYLYATDFYKAITTVTSGLMVPLTTANLLSHAIIGSVLENLDMDRLVREVGQAVAERILGQNESVDDVARELHERLLLRNESTKKLVVENIYRESEESQHNVNVFTSVANLSEARPLLRRVKGTRFTDKYMQTRYSHLRGSSGYSYAPSIPPRIPESPPRTFTLGGVSPPASPPRKVVTDFATFGGSTTASVFGTAVRSSPFSLAGKQAAFRGARGGGGGFNEDDDEDEGGQSIGFREDAITLEQAKRITMQSAWRNIRS